MRRLLSLLFLLLAGTAQAASITDATGRTVAIPDHVARVLPAGAPAMVLLAALAPDLMLGFPETLSDAARAALGPEAAKLPVVPHLVAGHGALEQVRALKPDLIVDYGDVTPAYAEEAKDTQAKLGVPTLLLDGSLAATPRILRELGAALHREARAEVLARLAESLLALPEPAPARRVVYLRGTDKLLALAPGGVTPEVFARLGWTLLAPEGHDAYRPVTLAQIAALDPDMIIFADPAMRGVVAASAAWRGLRAVREGHAMAAPALPFGWVDTPPSLNRLAALAWLGGHDAVTVAAMFDPVVYGHVPTPAELAAVAAATRPIAP